MVHGAHSMCCRRQFSYLVLGDDIQQGFLYGGSHVGCISTDIEVGPSLQQLPNLCPSLFQPVLHVHLPRLRIDFTRFKLDL